VALRLEIEVNARKAAEVLTTQEMRTEDLYQRAHLLRNNVKELEHILALTKTELAEEKAEKIKYIGLYEDKCK
jgi:bifunctional ADP-heptose synthase (sugar kinase/adenylyltransferase)